MTSEERHAARYARRKAKREAKRRAFLEEHGKYEDIITRTALSKAAKQATKGVKYKASVKRFMLRRLVNVNKIYHKLLNRQDVRKGFICFNLVDRGKLRRIMSVHFSERVPQKSLNKNALVPVFTRSLIYDNGASQTGKGTHFAIDRMVTHLRRYYRHHGNNGYVLVIDYEDYFGRIDHETAKGIVADMFDDPDIIWLASQFIDAYYDHKLKEAKRNGTDPKLATRSGLGLGSETNQTIAITYPNKVDHYIKEVLRVKGYERYMDDSILLGETKEELEYDLEMIRAKCAECKITISENKTYITKLSHGFTFLKTQFFLTDTGKVLRKPCHMATVRERRKLKKQAKLVASGEMTPDDVMASYQSFRGSLIHKQARRSLHKMDELCRYLIENAIKEYTEKGGSSNGGQDQRYRK